MNIIVGFFKWLWEIIKLPLTFNECVNLLKDVNMKLDSPAQHLAALQLQKEMFAIEKEALSKEKDRLHASDIQKKEQIDELITKLTKAEERNQELTNSFAETVKQRDEFHQAFETSEKERKQLSEQVKRSILIPDISSHLCEAMKQAEESLRRITIPSATAFRLRQIENQLKGLRPIDKEEENK